MALGATEPRLHTPPLVPLTPHTSYGYDVVEFAHDVLLEPLDPWQEWLVIHAGELLADGRPRFRRVLLIVARQNGKTHLAKVLALYWLFVERHRLVLGTSTNLDYAREAWQAAVTLSEASPYLESEVGKVRHANGEQRLTTTAGCRYQIAASTRRGGRGLTVDRLLVDELREHHDWNAYNAAIPAMNARPAAQAWLITNQGDDSSVVLDALRNSALAYIADGRGDQRLGLFEWSAEDDAEPNDPAQLALANPSLGLRTDLDALLGDAATAMEEGGEQLAKFRTEILCIRVHQLNPAIEPARWKACRTDTPLDLAGRDDLAACVDIALDGSHASLIVAAQIDGLVHVDVAMSWPGFGCAQALRADLPDLIRRIKPKTLGWLPTGPTAAVAADLAERRGRSNWPPRGTALEEIRGDLPAICMGLGEQVRAEQIRHSGDPMLDVHVMTAEKTARGDGWIFGRKDSAGPIDGTYALAGAVHLARTLRRRPALVALAPGDE